MHNNYDYDNDTEYFAYTLIGETSRRARKPHVCDCGAPISPGSLYTRRVEKVDGDISVSKIGDHLHAFEREEAGYELPQPTS